MSNDPENKNTQLLIQVLLNSYNLTKKEILSHHSLQTQCLQIGFTAIIAIIGYIFISNQSILITILPIVIIFNSHMFLHFMNQITYLGAYNLEIERKINRILNCDNDKIIYWELNFGGLSHNFIEKNKSSLRFFLGFAVLLLIGLTIFGIKLIAETFGWIWGFFILIIYIGLYISEYIFFTHVFTVRKNYRVSLTIQPNPNLQKNN